MPATRAPRRLVPVAVGLLTLVVGGCTGQGDATLLFGFKHEWDVAAGAALVEAAGGVVSDLWGEPLSFNQVDPRVPGVAAAGAALHPLLIERTRAFPDPRAKA